MFTRKLFLIPTVLFFINAGFIFGQNSVKVDDVPNHFGKVFLGMSMEQVKEALKEDENFRFTGDPEISILLRPNETLIECSGTYFIQRAYFQFVDDSLYTIILALNPDEIDHYSVFTTLSEKYGGPTSLDPDKSVWKSEKNMLVLERPLSVKYVDLKVLDKIRTTGKSRKTLKELSREQFLGQF